MLPLPSASDVPPRRVRHGAHAVAVAAAVAVAVGALVLGGCASLGDGGDTVPTGDGYALPPAGAAADYQLGGAYDPSPEVAVIARDRTAAPASDLYSICYVNGFQTQPGELESWPDDLLLRNDDGIVFDPAWPDEALLDTSTDANRAAIAATVGMWIESCADDGFAAVEFDNLDTYARSGGALSLDDNLALATALVEIAHGAGLAAGQKNAAEDSAALRERAGFDFAISEECAAFDECDAYSSVYGEQVIDIEYSDDDRRPFTEVCADPGTPASVVLRDRDLTTPDDPLYVFELCAGR